jgi:hypothetical protein
VQHDVEDRDSTLDRGNLALSDAPQIVLPWRYTPREYQVPIWEYMQNGGKRALCIVHRRAGKDVNAAAITSVAAYKRVGLYWHVFPTYELGRKALWNGITAEGLRIRDQWPEQCVVRRREDSMLQELSNGSMHQVVGANDPDALRGPNPVGVVFSEFCFYDNDDVWNIVRPILAENGGWAIFISTPNGRNHAHRLFESAKNNPAWYTELLTVDMTKRPDGSPVTTQASIQDDRDSGMSEAMIQQEYYCSWDTPFAGAIWGDLIRKIQDGGRITKVPYDANFPVHTWWDLGQNDATAIWYMQTVGNQRRFIDYDCQKDVSFDKWMLRVHKKPYVISKHVMPWDANHRTGITGDRRFEYARGLGMNVHVVERSTKLEGINAVRAYLARHECIFDEEKARAGVAALATYRWKKSLNGEPTEEPVHDEWSDGADAFRCGVMGGQDNADVHRGGQARAAEAQGAYDMFAPAGQRSVYTGGRPSHADDGGTVFGRRM